MMSIVSSSKPVRRRNNRKFTPSLWLVLIVVLTLLSGCSTTQWLYRNLDWFLERYAVKSLDVTKAQLQAWRPGVEQVLQQHLVQELPALDHYLNLMARFASESSSERADASCLVRGATLIFTRHARLAADVAVPLLMMLEPHQIDHLARYMKERDSRYRKRYLTGGEHERWQARTARLTERLEDWMGSLDSGQRARVELFTDNLPDIATAWFDYRNRQQERLLQLLREGSDADRLHAHLMNWWLPWAGKYTGFAAQWRKAETGFALLLDDLAVSLTTHQRRHFQDKVASLRNDLTVLHGDARQALRETPVQLRCRELQI